MSACPVSERHSFRESDLRVLGLPRSSLHLRLLDRCNRPLGGVPPIAYDYSVFFGR